MNNLKTMLAFSMLALLMAACQGNEYKITGTVEGAADGDTLVLTADMNENTPLQKIVIKGGAFEVQGEVDSVQLCALYVANQPDMNISFFLEPGNIAVKLAKEQEESSISGTTANDAWQQLNNTIASYNEKMQKLAMTFYDQNISEEEQATTMQQLQQMESEMAEKVINAAEKNIDNEMGFFIVTHFDDDTYFTPTRRRAIIDRMPAKFRNRSAVKEIEDLLKKSLSVEKGHQIDDFSLPTPEGNLQSVMEIISQNKLTILDFWASWCGPCRQEMPNMISLYEKYQPKGLAIIGISLDENQEAWTKAIKELGMRWPQLSDLKGWQSAAAELFQVRAIPHVVIVDQKGTILEKGLRGQQLEQFVGKQLEN